ncbi:hypothetical protein SEUCBS139899_010387 [Sporothrix eucalyptigena]
MATSFLPFLYPAKLVQRPLRAPVVRQFLRSLHATAPRANDSEQRPSRPPPSSKATRRIKHDHIPFELPDDFEPSSRERADMEGHIRIGTGNPADGTITPLERHIFRRIFRDLARKLPGPNYEEDYSELPLNDELPPDDDKASSHFARINSIISGASDDQVLIREPQRNLLQEEDLVGIEAVIKKEKASRERILAQFPPSLRAAAGKALGINDARNKPKQREEKLEIIMDEGVEEEEPAVAIEDAENFESTENVENSENVRNAENVQNVEESKKSEEMAAAQIARRERQTKMELTMLSKKTDIALWQYMEEQVFALVDKWGLRSDVPPGRRTSRKKKALAEDRPLYPALLLHGQRLLDSHFAGGTTSPLALAVIPRMKQLGLASYVLGASTPLYNHLMHIRWRRQGDAPAVFVLLEEMRRAGLPFNDATLAIVKSIEWHIKPLATREVTDVEGGAAVEENAVAAAAVKLLPDLDMVARQASYWRMNIQRVLDQRRQSMPPELWVE